MASTDMVSNFSSQYFINALLNFKLLAAWSSPNVPGSERWTPCGLITCSNHNQVLSPENNYDVIII